MAGKKIAYQGHFNHTMVYRILTDHKTDLRDHEKEALEKLRAEIPRVVSGVTNLLVEIHLEGLKQPITVKNGDGENKLIVHFGQDGEIRYEWLATLVKKDMDNYIKDLATKVAKTTMSILSNIVVETFKKSFWWPGQKALTWYN